MSETSPTPNDLFASALSLPTEQRVKLAHAILEILKGESAVVISEAWHAEIERRIAEYEAGLVETIPAEQVFAKYA